MRSPATTTRRGTVQVLDKNLLSSAMQSHAQILVGYLFGSFAEGVASRRSDVDVAALLEPSFNLKRSLEFRLALAGELSDLLKRDVEVVVLNEAPLLLQFQVVKCRKILFERDPEKRAVFEMDLMGRFYDYR